MLGLVLSLFMFLLWPEIIKRNIKKVLAPNGAITLCTVPTWMYLVLLANTTFSVDHTRDAAKDPADNAYTTTLADLA